VVGVPRLPRRAKARAARRLKLHPHAACLVATLDPRWRRKLWIGGLVLCVPFVGWPAVLGYRSRFVRRLREEREPTLPEWSEGLAGYAVDGWRAMAVIFGYLAPLYVTVAAIVLARGYVPDATTVWIALAFAAFPIFSTLSFPTACVLLACADPAWLAPSECALALVAYAAIVFVVPAGFLRVSVTGRHRDAFAVWWTLPFLWRHCRRYVHAWGYSAGISLCGHLAVPLSPWGVVWSYLAIVVLFNELLVDGERRSAPTALERAIASPDLQRPRRFGFGVIGDAAGDRVRVVDLRWFSAPLPGRA
jgi:hypothetical protein